MVVVDTEVGTTMIVVIMVVTKYERFKFVSLQISRNPESLG